MPIKQALHGFQTAQRLLPAVHLLKDDTAISLRNAITNSLEWWIY
jgi:hypothetical protein